MLLRFLGSLLVLVVVFSAYLLGANVGGRTYDSSSGEVRPFDFAAIQAAIEDGAAIVSGVASAWIRTKIQEPSGVVGAGSTLLPVPTPEPAVAAPADVGAPPGYEFHPFRIVQLLELCVDSRGDPALFEAVERALQTWSRFAEGNLPLTASGECPAGAANRVHRGPLDAPTAGLADIRSSSGGPVGSVLAIEIVIDESDPELHAGECLFRIVLHETGHAIGLAHQENGPSVMLPSADCPAASLDLSRDRQAVRYWYGAAVPPVGG